MSSSGSDAEDEDYVPEGAEAQQEEEERDEKPSDAGKSERATTSAHMSKLWEDLNASTSVSKKAADRTAKLLGAMTSGRLGKKKKRKLHEFQFTVLSLDPKRSRTDLAAASAGETVEQIVKFAGVEYSVAKKASAGASGSGIDKVLASMDAPKKVSTIEKTSIDWDKFKEEEGIEDELAQYTKDGYVEKQEFLQRLDLKRFEIEKAERDKQRKLQQQQQ